MQQTIILCIAVAIAILLLFMRCGSTGSGYETLKTVHVCHKSITSFEKYARRWKELNSEYELALYDDSMCRSFLADNFSAEHAEIFDFLVDGPIKADFWRLAIVYAKGGVYADADIEPLVPLRTYLDIECDFGTCVIDYIHNMGAQARSNYNAHFLFGKAHNAVVGKCLEIYLQKYRSGEKYDYDSWSINPVLFEVLKPYNFGEEGIFHVDGMRIQLLKNVYQDGLVNEHAQYKGVRVLNNRYATYRNHQFQD